MAGRGTALIRKRVANRPRLRLHLDDVQATTKSRYDFMIAQLNTLMTILGGVTVDTLLSESETGAVQIWVLLLMQLHYDVGSAGVSEIGNLLSGLSRLVRLSVWVSHAAAPISDAFLRPLWKAFSHWKRVEPYEFRMPLPRTCIHALMGACVFHNRWHLLLFVLLTFHCWLRPNECLQLTWRDICVDSKLEALGVVTIRNPKIKVPHTQHVLIECPFVAAFCAHMKNAHGGSVDSQVFSFTTYGLHKNWTFLVQTLALNQLARHSSGLVTHATPGGLRSSGATLDFLNFESLDRVKWRGIWATDGALKHYLQLGVYHLAAVQLSRETRWLVSKYSNIFLGFAVQFL